ncbi:MAG: 50S ribosomal protein L13 [Parcubacteria group bacterium]|nr:50S ribosomal protein L13 [Parcubacteria group bacterium]
MSEYRFDATGEILGRLASRVALLLRGKESPSFRPNAVSSVEITVFNTDKLKFSGNKLQAKKYYRHSGYPGGIKVRSLEEFMVKDSREVFRQAVYGMLPKNRLRSKLIKKLKLLKGAIGSAKLN